MAIHINHYLILGNRGTENMSLHEKTTENFKTYSGKNITKVELLICEKKSSKLALCKCAKSRLVRR
jgi:hypothetical protein